MIYLWAFIGLVAAPIARMLVRPEKGCEFPCFMAAAFAVFILPQALSLVRFPGGVSAESVEAALLMSCLCLAACLAGYQAGPVRAIVERTSRPADPDRLFAAGLALMGAGFVFDWHYRHAQVEFADNGGMTGTATILLFFQNLLSPGLAICALDAVRRPRCASVAAAVIGLVIPLQTALAGRREPTVLLGATIMLALYFGPRIKPPRLVLALAMAAAGLAIPATGAYRGLRAEHDWDAIRQIDLVGNFKKYLTEESVLELRNAAAVIQATRATGDYELGAVYWDHVVFRFVPAQLVGADLKSSLMIHPEGRLAETERTETGFELSRGSTITGMADAFQQFGWFGCLFFALEAVLFRSLWEAAQRPAPVFAQLLYMTSCTTAMRSVTHWTADFLPGLIYNGLFLGAAFLYAREPETGDWKLNRSARRTRREGSASKAS
jgi:hypothetical protein